EFRRVLFRSIEIEPASPNPVHQEAGDVPAQHGAAARQPDVCEEHRQLPDARGSGRPAQSRFFRRNHPRDVRHPCRGDTQAMSDYWSMVFVFVLATFIGLGVIRRVSRLLYTPLMSLTNAISA